jgi:hypothetical protein
VNASIRSSDFIGELCIALAHRRDAERLFMVLTGYFDESGVHGGSPVTIMAGYIAEARQWRKFEKRASKIFKKYNVDIFHTIDVRRTDKDFTGWSIDKKLVFIDEFTTIINETLGIGVSSVIHEADYRKFYADKERPSRVIVDSKYGILFRASLASAIKSPWLVNRWREGEEPKLNIVLESGHPNAGDAVRLYDFFKQGGSDRRRVLSGLTFESKADCLPLAAADMFAYVTYQKEVGAKLWGVLKKPSKAAASYPGNLYRVDINQQALTLLYNKSIS